ncbi:hypothetical protein PV963_27950 [Streptomyces coeruleorubidus]|uniref:hypothetical protein n=1 Tax=Streptomyces coeruleorubidus TaxID=116188 RepID=UPI00237F3532|nr:hypothetical protein [Streptomyces coeruleorubidus]WDV53917.1 hypothetical protein PV963_27950 [Streptomyces coeruleorubidus]
MDTSEVIAALALGSIPVSVVIARWQMRAPLRVERARWLADARHTSYGLFQKALAQFRRSLLASEVVLEELNDAMHDLHNAAHVVSQVGPNEVGRLAEGIMRRYEDTTREVGNEISRGLLPTPEARAEAWAAQAPLRVKLDKAIQRVYDRHWG